MYKADCVLPYRLLRTLVDKPELGLPVLTDTMFDLVCCLRLQIADLGGLGSTQTKGTKQVKVRGVLADESSKKPSKKGALKAEILQSSILFFNSLDSETLWKWMSDLLKDTFGHLTASERNAVSERAASKSEQEQVVRGKVDEEMSAQDDVQNQAVLFPNVDQDVARSSSPISELVELQETQKQDHRRQETTEECRNGHPSGLRTLSNQVSSSSVVSGADKRDFLFVFNLIKFLIHSLPLVSRRIVAILLMLCVIIFSPLSGLA